jgi:hypothetical protein
MTAEVQISIGEGRRILRDIQSAIGKPRNRLHDDMLEDTSHKLRALNGDVCATCEKLRVFKMHTDGRDRVSLRCSAKLSPLELYRNTELGKQYEVKCNERVPIEVNAGVK